MNNNDFYKWYGENAHDAETRSFGSWGYSEKQRNHAGMDLALKEIAELKSQIHTMHALIDGLRDAIENEGPNPKYHRSVYRKHRKKWPTLWRSIDSILSYSARNKPKFY